MDISSRLNEGQELTFLDTDQGVFKRTVDEKAHIVVPDRPTSRCRILNGPIIPIRMGTEVGVNCSS